MRWLALLLVLLAGCEPIPDEPDREKVLEQITTLGYLVASEPAPERSGVTVHEPEAYPGYTLFTLRCAPSAWLIDMQGNVVKQWSVPGAGYWSRVRPHPDGGLVVITGRPNGMMRLDPDGNVMWHRPGGIHHDMEMRDDGRIYTLYHETAEYPEVYPKPVVEDFVLELDADGNEIRRVSILQGFLKSAAYRNWLDVIKLPETEDDIADIFHTNSVQVLDAAESNDVSVLLSIRSISTICVLDMASEEIVWAMTGMWQKQHEARLLPGGTMMLFDNLGHEGRSKVIEFWHVSQEIVWQYDAPEFSSKTGGTYQPLPNGNVLITDTTGGRIFEVTRKGRTVWEYINPISTPDSLVVHVPRAERISLN